MSGLRRSLTILKNVALTQVEGLAASAIPYRQGIAGGVESYLGLFVRPTALMNITALSLGCLPGP